MNQRAAAFRGTTAVEAVETADGTRIEGDLVVVGVGAGRARELAAEAGLDVGDGILVDEHLETSAPGIFAAGDVAAAWHPLLGFASPRRALGQRPAPGSGRRAEHARHGRAVPFGSRTSTPTSTTSAWSTPATRPTWDRVVFRGEPADRAFIAFWLKGGRVVAGMNANVWQVNDSIAALVASRATVDVERLVDPAVPLDDLPAPGSGAEIVAA